nr:hypothetical protein [uncultured bacterium]
MAAVASLLCPSQMMISTEVFAFLDNDCRYAICPAIRPASLRVGIMMESSIVRKLSLLRMADTPSIYR